eukprot:6239135-Amphidinium_carterae.1
MAFRLWPLVPQHPATTDASFIRKRSQLWTCPCFGPFSQFCGLPSAALCPDCRMWSTHLPDSQHQTSSTAGAREKESSHAHRSARASPSPLVRSPAPPLNTA